MNWRFWKRRESRRSRIIIEIEEGQVYVTADWPTPHSHEEATEQGRQYAALITAASEGQFLPAMQTAVGVAGGLKKQRDYAAYVLGLINQHLIGTAEGVVNIPSDTAQIEPPLIGPGDCLMPKG